MAPVHRSWLMFTLALGAAATCSATLFAQNGYLYANNATGGTAYIYKIDLSTGNIVATYTNLDPSAVNGRGVAVVGSTMYYTSAYSKCVYKYDLTSNTDKGCFFKLPASAPGDGLASLAYDGTNLWVQEYSFGFCCPATDRVFKCNTLAPASASACVVAGTPSGCQSSNMSCDGLEYFRIPGTPYAGGVLISNKEDKADPYDVYAPNNLSGAPLTFDFISSNDGTNAGIAWDGAYFYTSDILAGFVEVFDATGGRPLRTFQVKNAPKGYPPDIEDLSIDYAATPCDNPPNTAMVAWYPFDELAGTTSTDLAAGNTGTQVNGPLGTSSGEVLGAASFNGTNQFVEAPSSMDTNFGPAGSSFSCNGGDSTCYGNFSIDTWINVPTGATTDVLTIVDKRAGSIPLIYGYALAVETNQQGLVLQLADGGAAPGYTNYQSPTLSPPLQGTGWHHIAVAVNRLSPITWYYDGLKIGADNPRARQGSLVNSSPLRIGTRTAEPPLSGWFNGKLDELEIYNRELTPNEVLGIYQAGPYGKCKPSP